jgi:hypothetical protein
MDSMVQGSIKEILVYSSAMVTFAPPWRPLSILDNQNYGWYSPIVELSRGS